MRMQDLEKCQFVAGRQQGHYESYFLRGNHPDEPKAFWIRYTIFSPKNHPEKAIGEIWAMYFDADINTLEEAHENVVAVQENIPLKDCQFPNTHYAFKIGDNTLSKVEQAKTEGVSSGSATLKGHEIRWNLNYKGASDALLLLPEKMYSTALPKAKSLVTTPNVLFNGSLVINGKTVNFENWQGSENHNWGSKHTDEYAWGQVAGFDGHPNTFLECSTARIKLGPIWSPWMTLAVLDIDGQRYYFNEVLDTLKAKALYDYKDSNNQRSWHFKTKNKQASLEVNISAPKEYFAGLYYKNPPGGCHTCLNSKIASCEIKLLSEKGKETVLRTRNRAAFEILTDAVDHGIKVRNS